MRPLSLRLQAFGSYAGEIKIDFARLGLHGVFSITGPTGSGKSTIFDGIVYALYDDLPGFRTDSHIRSQYADDETPTSVTLSFEADGREWVVERSPSQHRPRKRGGGAPVVEDSRVVLKELGTDGGGITRKSAVADELLRLVGLTKAQFEQVVLIPQGKFEEVLKADTKDRALLLSRLFPVDVFRRTTESLRELAAARKSEYEGLSAGSDALVDQIRVDIVDALGRAPDGFAPLSPDDPSLSPEAFDLGGLDDHRTALAQLADALGAAREVARDAVTAIRGRREVAEALATRWDLWQADLRTAQDYPTQADADRIGLEALERARTVARLGPALTQWRTATAALVRSDDDQARLRASIDEDWSDTYSRDDLAGASTASALAAVADTHAHALEEADRQHTDLVRRGRELSDTDTRLAAQDIAVGVLQVALEAADATLTAARAGLEAAASRSAGRGPVEIRVHELERARDAAVKRTSARAHLAQLESELQVAADAEAVAAIQVDAVRGAWRAGLAGRLSEHLVDGRPCPTCGSEVHPSPAAATVEAPTDGALQAVEEALSRRSSASQSLRVELARATASLEALAGVDDGAVDEHLSAAQAELTAIVTAEVDATRIATEIEEGTRSRAGIFSELGRESAALQTDRATQVARRQQWEVEQTAFAAAHGELASTGDAAQSRRRLADGVARLAASLQASESSTATLAQSLGMLGPTLVEWEIEDPAALDELMRPTEQIEDEARALERRAVLRREVEERIIRYDTADGPAERPDAAPLLDAERIACDRLDDLVGRVAVVMSRIESIAAARHQLATRSGIIEVARRQKEEAETLASACAGLGGGPTGTKVSLENWVLAYYLRQVLAQANLRLDTMTSGRYALELNREYTDGRKPWGLDLSVLDAETGQSRPATTLSGGETFMAALSLALGLADVVSAGSNYSIGALFVDEGFGSLDGESLDTVIDVLRSLQDGGRMVGVISHVQDLKDALPNGITIGSTNHGSVAMIHYPE
jgi:exonuclease SbcC